MTLLSTLYGGGGGGLKPKFQEFTASGTFTPSAGLLAQGGVCTVHLFGGGGGGGGGTYGTGVVNLFGGIGTGTVQYGGGGGGSGVYKRFDTIVSSAVTITIGAGGNGQSIDTDGSNGGDSSFGSSVAKGGIGGLCGVHEGIGGSGEHSGGYGKFGASFGMGGVGGSSSAGGLGGKPWTAGGLAAGGGGGMGYVSYSSNIIGANGGSGYCLVEWWE